ncbi:MAG: hypothetical protein K1X89_20620 [Myxococcaceae bacterium]|nr:hypothetical protein [Myxococcaceae bacterium]
MVSRVRSGAPLDLNQLYGQDPGAANVGFALNEPTLGGVSLDGNNQVLTRDEFVRGAAALAPQLAEPVAQAALARLQQRFDLGGVAPAPPAGVAPTNAPLLHAKDLKPLVLPSLGIDIGADMVVVGKSVVTAADTFDASMSRGRLVVGRRSLTAQFPQLGAVMGSPSWVTRGTRTELYFLAAPDLASAPRMYRSTFSGNRLSTPTPVALPPGVDSMISWPKVVGDGGDRLLMISRDATGQIHLSASADGARFQDTGVAFPQGAMHSLARSPGGTLAVSYQQGQMVQMHSLVRVSHDGRRFSAPLELAPWSPNVHDATLLPRADGRGFDAYFIANDGGPGFSLFRRQVRDDGTLGATERLTSAAETGEASKPSVVRLPGGGVRLVVAQIAQRAPTGEPSVQRFLGATLPGDVPAT